MGNGGTLGQAKQAEDMMVGELPWLAPVIALTIGAVVAVMLALLLPRHRQGLVGAWAAGSHLAAAALAAVVWLDRGFERVMSGTLVVDGLSLTLAGVLGVGGAICIVLARPTVAGTDREGEFYAVMTAASLAALVLGTTADAALLAIALGFLSLASFILTAYLRRSAAANEASIKYYIYGTVAGACMAYGLSWWFGVSGTTAFTGIGEALPDAPTGIMVASTALVLVGLGYKAALVPFHFWTPDVYEGSPVPVAAYLSVLPKIAGLVALARVLPMVLPDGAAGWPTVMAVIAAVTMTVGNVAALPQRNVVRLLAYSSIAQSGYLAMAVAALDRSDLALPALLFYAIAYAVSNLAAFAVVMAVQRERGSVELTAFTGLGRTHPWWTAVLAVSLLSLFGLPPLAGFVGKLEVFRASIDAGQTWLAVIAIANTVISLYYYVRVIAPAVLDWKVPVEDRQRRPLPALGAVVLVTGLATVAVGVVAQPLLTLAEHAHRL
jgi:proton-translocating NADH-quinone oxidoreductase chain N